MSELGEAASVLSAVAEIILETNVRVKINTVALSDGKLFWFPFADVNRISMTK